jgi:hypothetical protein
VIHLCGAVLILRKTEPKLSGYPQKWVQKHLPLLDQFICSNPERLKFCYYGISAQGGDYLIDKDHLLDLNPIQRTDITSEMDQHPDIASPVKWILEKTKEQ